MAKRIEGKYRCCECGHIFEEDELIAREEDMGEAWGRPCTQTWYYSPCCMDDYEEYEEPEDEEDDEEEMHKAADWAFSGRTWDEEDD